MANIFGVSVDGDRINVTSGSGIALGITSGSVHTDITAPSGYKWDIAKQANWTDIQLALAEAGNYFLRNGSFNYPVPTDDVERAYYSFNAGVAIASWSGEEGGGWIGSVVANSKYIYYVLVEGSTISVCEYDTVGQSTQTIEVATGLSMSGDSMALVEDRKVLVAAIGSGIKDVYLVDFEADSSSTSTSMTTQIDTLRTHLMGDGHIWGYALGKTATGYQVKYKDFTDDTSWTSVTLTISYDTHPVGASFVGDDYLVWFADKKISSSEAQVIPIVFDCNSFTLTEGSAVSHTTDSGISTCAIDMIGSSWKSGPKAYCTAYAWGTDVYYMEQLWVEYIPSTDSTSIIYDHKWHNTPEQGASIYTSPVFSSNEYVYIMDGYDHSLHGTDGGSASGDIQDQYDAGNDIVVGQVMDDYPCFYFLGVDGDLYIYDTACGSVQTLSCPVPGSDNYPLFLAQIFHLGAAIGVVNSGYDADYSLVAYELRLFTK